MAPNSKRIKRENLVAYEKENANPTKKQKIQKKKKLPKRNRVKTDRFGKRVSTSNYDEYFENLEKRKRSISHVRPNSSEEQEAQQNNTILESTTTAFTPLSNPSCSPRKSLIVVQTRPNSPDYDVEPLETQSSISRHNVETENLCHCSEYFMQFFEKLETSVNERYRIIESVMECMKVQIARVEAKVTESTSITRNRNHECIYESDETPSSIGLPVKTKDELDAFEQQHDDPSFENKVVSEIIHILCHSFEMIHYTHMNFLDLGAQQSP